VVVVLEMSVSVDDILDKVGVAVGGFESGIRGRNVESSVAGMEEVTVDDIEQKCRLREVVHAGTVRPMELY
jgi:hypothetical protein